MDAIILLHAFGSSHRAWRPQMEALNRHFRVLAPDLPGEPRPFTLDRAVDTVRRIVTDQPGIVHLAGTSGGATVALLARLAEPKRVASLLLSTPVALCGERDRANARTSAEVAAGIPNAELRMIAHAGHPWNLEQPELFNRTNEAFVARAVGQ